MSLNRLFSVPRLYLQLLVASMLGLGSADAAAPAGGVSQRPINLLFIITDQQRFDALGCMGNPVVRTPNLDRLARQGARFVNAYSSCPVCVPARTVILTGRSIESTKVRGNGDVNSEEVPNLVTFDQVLLRNGYQGEYHGKWHSPYKFALDYTRPVLWLNGKQAPPGSKAEMSEAEAFKKYVAAHVPERELKPGEYIANMYGRPYLPDKMDPASTGEVTDRSAKRKKKKAQGKAADAQVSNQATTYGCLVDVPPEHTLAAWTVKEGLEALDRLKDMPFTLTVSIGPPHPPMVLPKPWFGMYPAAEMPVPVTIGDRRTNSPYARPGADVEGDAYRDPAKVRQMISDYYGLVSLDDEWIGRLLKRLDELGLADHTLVVFTSDHGEMLGDHGMHSKTVFYEGSAHVPLLMRLPGIIKAGTVVTAPVSHIDYYATVLDYLAMQGPPSEGRSLRPLIEGKGELDRIAVSEWARGNVPGYMAFDGRWKLMFGRSADALSLDALYDLKSDPPELTNLIGSNPDRERYRAQAERMKGFLVAWLERTKSPNLEQVKARPLLPRTEPSGNKRGRQAPPS
jgi:arylsulfatase A-like enzyme